MSRDSEDNSTAEADSIHAPTTIPEEPTPVSPASPASPGIPIDPLPRSEQPVKQPPAGRFIENISTDGSRASAEDEAANSAPPPTSGGIETAETNKAARNLGRSGSNVWRPNSNKKNATTAAAAAQPGEIEATAGGSSNGHAQQISPTTDSSTQRASPYYSNDQSSSPSSQGGGGRHFRSFKKIKGDRGHTHRGIQEKGHNGDDDRNNNDEDRDDHDDDDHSILAALYPLTNFIGYRPLSHPHTPPDIRRTPNHPRFNRFHYLCGRIFSFGLPVSGETGQIARYRDPDTGKIHLVTMYKDQAGAKIINSIHSLIAAWVIIALLSLVSRSPFHRSHNAPLIIGAFATEAVVTFFPYRTPLAPPKNILFGNAISAIIGVAMEKAFAHTNYDLEGVYGVDWAAAATTVSVAIFAMQILGFVHPPGAAIALLSITNKKTNQLDWWLVPIVIIGSCIVIGWALLINNVGGRRYPENWFYANAFAEPPIIGPEKLPFSNSPWHPRVQRQKRKRSTKPQQDENEQEKGFYRVPDSGARVRHGWGPEPKLKPKPKEHAVPMAGMASHNLGGAERVKNATAWSRGDDGDAGGSGSNGGGNGNGVEDGRQTRNSEMTKINSVDSEAAVAHANPTITAPTSIPTSTAPAPATAAATAAATEAATAAAATAGSGSEPQVKSRMIETDATVISRNNSKGSRRSRRSTTVVIHVNENRRHSTGSSNSKKVPPVPAVQWRGRDGL